MKYRNNISRRFLSAFMAVVLACGCVPVSDAWGVGAAQSAGVAGQASGVSVQSEDAEDGQGVAAGDAIGADDESGAGTAGGAAADADDAAAGAGAIAGTAAAIGEGAGAAGDAFAAADAASQTGAAALQDAAAASSAVLASNGGEAEGAAADDPTTAAEAKPYDITVTFDGQELSEGDGQNNLTDVWTTGSKKLNVKLKRNKNVAVDPTKQYVLCMSVPDTLYFSGVPDVSKINGVEEVAMIQNAAPKFNTALNASFAYPLSSCSGQMRMLLNTSVDEVTIADLDVLFNPQLLGYMATDSTVLSDALNIRIVAVDGSEKLDSFADDGAEELSSCRISSIRIKNGAAPTTDGGLRMRLSTDGFNQQSATSGQLKLGRSGNITYVLEAAQKSTQVYKKLTVVLSCPYIWADGDGDGKNEKHYLSFDEKSSVLATNRMSATAAGFNMTGPARYDADAHTITYTFENLYIAAWQMIAVTPQFSWPSELGDSVPIPDKGYQVYFEDSASGRKAWTLTEEQTYCGTNTTLLPVSHNGSGSATFINDGVNITLKSSAEDVAAAGGDPKKSTLGKRVIYKDVTRAEGVSAGLGYFDLHNEGVTAAPASKVTFEFNTDSSDDATYYVNRVNIPLDGNDGGTDIYYELVNGAGDVISGTRHFDDTSSFYLYASTLKSGAGSGQSYYFKKISYTTSLLRAGAQYHTEVTHGKRNFIVDSGLYFGYIEGNVGDTAHAKMTIESVDGSALNSAGDLKLEATETTWMGDDDSVYLEMTNTANTKGVDLDGAYSQSITAGGTTTLSFRTNATNSEDQVVETSADGKSLNYTGILNGYHTVRNPIMYVCLPKGVAIAGTEQASLVVSGKATRATNVKQLADCTYEGVDATWWEVRFEGASIKMTSARIDLKLSSSLFMPSVSWNFEKAVAFRAGGQPLKGTSVTTGCSQAVNNVARFKQLAGDNSMLQALATALESDPNANDGKLGLYYFTYSVATTLNVTRAEAKLDVETELSTKNATSGNIKVTDAASEVTYKVNVSSTDGGSAENFNYYIPVPKQTAALDASSFVAQKDYDLQLKGDVQITDLSGANEASPFEVLYTTKEGLDSTQVAALEDGVDDPSAGWVDGGELGDDYSAVTAILIRTKVKASVSADSQYRFEVTLGYNNAANDFASQAGRSVMWRSFGHYTYTRNGAETTNTYPSQENSVKLGYVADYRNAPVEAKIATDAESNIAYFTRDFAQAFKNNQTIIVKNVVVRSGTALTSEDPSDFTGSDANSMFKMTLGINDLGTATLVNGFKGGSFGLSAGSNMVANGGVRFSRALTDTTTERYVDVVLGNDDIDITMRIKLVRTVKAASVSGSGTVEGENFQVPGVSTDPKTIAANGSVTALYDIANFRPGNFTAQQLAWKQGGSAAAFPAGTTVTMLVLGDDNTAQSWWLWRADGSASSVDLESFKQMAGSAMFSYDKASTTATELKYQFVVSFPTGNNVEGSYSLVFEAVPKQGVDAVSSELPVILAKRSGFSLNVDGGNVTYGYTASAGDDVRTTGKQLSLVLKPSSGVNLPADARIRVGGVEYARNGAGEFIVPRGTVDSGSASLELVSGMLGAEGGSFGFDMRLMLSGADISPMAGAEVATGAVTLSVAAGDAPSVSVTGTRVAHKSEWANGVDFSFAVDGSPADAKVTVSAYSGLTQSTPATNLLSSVGGVFDVNGGTGTYKGGTSTDKLVLNSAADAGTYRLVFEVKKGDSTLLSVPYYVVVRD